MKTNYLKNILFCLLFFAYFSSAAQTNPDSLWEISSVANLHCQLKKGEQKVFYYRFAEDDTLYLNYAHHTPDENLSSFEVRVYKAGTILQKSDTKSFTEKIAIANESILAFTLINASSKAISGQLQISRRAAYDETARFNVNVPLKTIYDTTYTYEKQKVLAKHDTTATEIMNRTFMVGSRANLKQAGRSTVSFKLPEQTAYWVYHLSISEETNVQLDKLGKELSKVAATALAADPLVAFGIGVLGSLPAASVGEDIDYYLLAPKEASVFESGGEGFKYYKKVARVVSDYARILPHEAPNKGEVHFGFYNDNFIEGIKATMRVVAIKIKPIFEWKTVRKPQKAQYFVPVE